MVVSDQVFRFYLLLPVVTLMVSSSWNIEFGELKFGTTICYIIVHTYENSRVNLLNFEIRVISPNEDLSLTK